MTSRFKEAYSRRGGNGCSKSDEVFSNKRTTLSTKWGETTFMAKLGQKRPNFKSDIQEIPKKPKVKEENTGDPFGFDSDDASLPVSSKNLAQGKGSSYSESCIAAQQEGVTSVLKANSQTSQSVGEDSDVSDKCLPLEETLLGKEESTNRTLEDDANISSRAKLMTSVKVENLHEEYEKKSHYSLRNAEDSAEKPKAETTVASGYKTDEIKETNDTWNSQFGERFESPSEISPVKGSVRTGLYVWDNDFEDIKSEDCILSLDNDPLLEMKDEDFKSRLENLNEATAENIVQRLLRPSNCRTYCRANKAKSAQGASHLGKLMDGTSQALAKANSESSKDGLNQAKKGGVSCGTSFRRTVGQTRDYTLLHPSCLSVRNVTLQDTMEGSLDEFSAAAPADLGKAGRLSKKADIATSKTTTRVRPSNAKSKKDVKLEFFGFEDHDAEGSGSSNYKIKYFGFDDLSENEDDEDDDCPMKRKTSKKRTKTAPSPSLQPPPKNNDNPRGSRSSTNKAQNFDFTEDLPAVPESLEKPINKQRDKSKENTRKIFSGPKWSPTKAVYNARHWNHPDSEELPGPPVLKPQSVTLYTIVQHVKQFNDVVEFGENQEFTDDIEYLLSGLKSTQPLNTRCLSVISLATKCAMPSFRLHLRARGMVAMVFKTLDDSQHHQNLSLCTAALMYILSRDRLNMDLDRASLDLMIQLLELERDASPAKLLNEKDMNKIKEKVRRLCETVHNKHLDLENITTGHLAMETLLSLTSKRAGDWFKEELRLLGGLNHIVDKVKECVDHLSRHEDEEKLVAALWGAERCLRVLENVTEHNPENQSYLIAYKDSQLIVSSAKALRHCEELIQQRNCAEDSICLGDSKPLPNHVGKAVEDCMRAIFGGLLNLTNDNEWGSTKTGEQDGLIGTAMNCVLQLPKYLPQGQRFDIRVLGLCLLINLVERSARNRHCLVNMETSCSFDSSFYSGEEKDSLRIPGPVHAVQALVQLFLERQRAAQLAESKTDELIKDAPATAHDKSGEWQETSGEIQWVSTEQTDGTEEIRKKEEEGEELDLNTALQQADKDMEDYILASYTALLLGCLCQQSPISVTTVRKYLPGGDFSIMTEMLRKFLSFMNLTRAVGTTGQKSISRVIEYLEHC
uniref:Wings apart-like protein homolog n=1 Tax=Otolemur garnettii TaxID=30611 RepID=H0XLG8_OTOGA